MQALTQWLLGPVRQSVMFCALCYALPFGAIMAIVTQTMITLRQGMSKGLVVTLASVLMGVSIGYWANSFFVELSYTDFVSNLIWLLTLTLPLWVIAGLLRKTVSWTFSMQIMTVGFMLLFVICFIGDINIYPLELRNLASENVAKLTNEILVTQQKMASDEAVMLTPENIAGINSFLICILEVITLYVMYFLFLVLARTWQSVIFQPGGFKQEFINMQPGKLLITALSGIWLLLMLMPGNLTSYALAGVATIGMIWLFFNGLAFVHWLVTTYQLSWIFVFMLYLGLSLQLVNFILLFILVFVGLVIGFIDLRALALKNKSSGI